VNLATSKMPNFFIYLLPFENSGTYRVSIMHFLSSITYTIMFPRFISNIIKSFTGHFHLLSRMISSVICTLSRFIDWPMLIWKYPVRFCKHNSESPLAGKSKADLRLFGLGSLPKLKSTAQPETVFAAGLQITANQIQMC